MATTDLILLDVSDPEADELLASIEAEPGYLDAGFAAVSDGLLDDASWEADRLRLRSELIAGAPGTVTLG